MRSLLDRALETFGRFLNHEISYEELREDEAYSAMVEHNAILNEIPMKEAKDKGC